jgi:hypothetical protein
MAVFPQWLHFLSGYCDAAYDRMRLPAYTDEGGD